MRDYKLYLESGPKRRKTVAHALDLVGCVQQFPTTDEAISGAAEMVRAFLRLLQQHGEDVDADAPFTTSVAVQDLHGGFLGTAYLLGDSEPIDAAECERLQLRYEWIRSATLELVDPLDPDSLEAKPAAGRPVGRILSHITGADYSYVTPGFRIEGLHAVYTAADQGAADPRILLRESFAMIRNRLRAMAPGERETVRERASGPWTVRHMYRKLLEHNWEHYQEIARRLGEG